MKLCCSVLGIAIRANFLRITQSNRFTGPVHWILHSLLHTVNTASRQLVPWHRKVAQATPETPMENAVTNRISRKMLDTEEIARNTKGVLLSPIAEKIPVERL